MPSHLIPPHGGSLVNLMVSRERAEELKARSRDWPSWDLTPRQVCDLELLMNGGFSPLRGFLGRSDYEGVCEDMRLADDTLWPIPVTLDVTEETAKALHAGSALALRDSEGVLLAALRVEDVWRPDREKEARQVYWTTDSERPGAAHLLRDTNPWYVGGRIEGVRSPRHYDFRGLRMSPAELREHFASLGWRRVVGFQPRNPMHRPDYEMTFRTARETEANLLIQPVVGSARPDDVDHYTRVKCYQAALKYYPRNTAMLSLLPLAMRPAGPREALWRAIICKNFGCTHFIAGTDHGGVESDSTGDSSYEKGDAREMMRWYQDEIGIRLIPFKRMVYVADRDEYVPAGEAPEGSEVKTLSETELRERLAAGREIPSWFSFTEVVRELQRACPPRSRQGFTVFFTGLPSAGKSTLANALMVKLLEIGGRPVTLLDGDIVRKHLSSELGFSKEHRDINIIRIGFVASEITKNGGIALCAPIAPYDNVRKRVREMIQPRGGFVLVHVATPLAVCERRDRKGLYAKARAGIVERFTGISDPYEAPTDAEVVIDTTAISPEEGAQQILLHLEKLGYIGPGAHDWGR